VVWESNQIMEIDVILAIFWQPNSNQKDASYVDLKHRRRYNLDLENKIDYRFRKYIFILYYIKLYSYYYSI